MAQTWRVRSRDPETRRPPLDSAAIERLAIGYAGRYATSRAKLRDYLKRKLGERGWADGDGATLSAAAAVIDTIVERFAELGYVDDRALAESRARTLAARGYGARRLGQALGALGIAAADGAEARQQAEEGGGKPRCVSRGVVVSGLSPSGSRTRRRGGGPMVR